MFAVWTVIFGRSFPFWQLPFYRDPPVMPRAPSTGCPSCFSRPVGRAPGCVLFLCEWQEESRQAFNVETIIVYYTVCVYTMFFGYRNDLICCLSTCYESVIWISTPFFHCLTSQKEAAESLAEAENGEITSEALRKSLQAMSKVLRASQLQQLQREAVGYLRRWEVLFFFLWGEGGQRFSEWELLKKIRRMHLPFVAFW